jgi:hypothetical protein
VFQADDSFDEALKRALPARAPDVTRLAEAARAELAAHPSPRPWWRDALLLLGVNALVAIGGVLAYGPAHSPGEPVVRYGVAALLFAVVTLGAVVAIRPGARGLRIAFLSMGVVATLAAVFGGDGVESTRPFARGIGCAVTECLLSIPTLGVALWVLSRFSVSASRTLAASAASAAAGVLVLHLHCPIGTVEHLAVFHVAPWLMLVGLVQGLRRLVPTHSHAP